MKNKTEEKNKKNTTPIDKINKSWMKKEGELAVDIYGTSDHIVIQAPIAGVKKEDLEITTENDMVIIKGERKSPERKDLKDSYTKECFYGEFRREVILPEETDPSRIEADIKEGILTIKAPKIEKEKKRKINI